MPDYRVPFANRFFRERFGESHGRRCFEYLFGRMEPCEICETYKVLKTNAPRHWEWTGPDSRNYDVFDFPFKDADGSPLIMEMGIDIIERKRAEIELEKYREHLEELVEERTRELEAANVQLRSEIIERQRAKEALQRNSERLLILSETASRLLASSGPQEIVNELCTGVMKFLDCHAFFNFLADDTAGKLHLNAYAGISNETARDIEWLDYGTAVCGFVAQDGHRIIAENIPETLDSRTDLVKSFGIKAYACHPLMSQGKVIGTLSFGTCSRTSFNDGDLAMMSAVTDQVAIAMSRIRSEYELRKARDELELRVHERTAELSEAKEDLEVANEELKVELIQHEQMPWQMDARYSRPSNVSLMT